MSTTARRRLMRDFKRLQEDPPMGITGAPTENNIMRWNAVIFGPADTSFEEGIFRLVIEFSEEYPNKSPRVKFLSKMFHPNIYTDGSICLDILQSRWSPTFDVSALLTSIQSLLSDPNPYSPANEQAAQLYRENKREYEKRIKDCVEQSWLEDDEEEEEKDIISIRINPEQVRRYESHSEMVVMEDFEEDVIEEFEDQEYSSSDVIEEFEEYSHQQSFSESSVSEDGDSEVD